jgi:hypothetical protein
MMNASFSSTSSFQVPNTKVCSLLCRAHFHSDQRSEGQKYEEESSLFILRSRLERVQWFSRRHWRHSLSLFSWRSQDLYHQEINEKQFKWCVLIARHSSWTDHFLSSC